MKYFFLPFLFAAACPAFSQTLPQELPGKFEYTGRSEYGARVTLTGLTYTGSGDLDRALARYYANDSVSHSLVSANDISFLTAGMCALVLQEPESDFITVGASIDHVIARPLPVLPYAELNPLQNTVNLIRSDRTSAIGNLYCVRTNTIAPIEVNQVEVNDYEATLISPRLPNGNGDYSPISLDQNFTQNDLKGLCNVFGYPNASPNPSTTLFSEEGFLETIQSEFNFHAAGMGNFKAYSYSERWVTDSAPGVLLLELKCNL